jgi:hypothetical protein
MMANLLVRKNETEKAIQQYKDIIERNPSNGSTLSKRHSLWSFSIQIISTRLYRWPNHSIVLDASMRSVKYWRRPRRRIYALTTMQRSILPKACSLCMWTEFASITERTHRVSPSYLCKPNEALSCFNKCRRDKQYGRQSVYAMVKIVLNPDNEIIGNEEDWKRLLSG